MYDGSEHLFLELAIEKSWSYQHKAGMISLRMLLLIMRVSHIIRARGVSMVLERKAMYSRLGGQSNKRPPGPYTEVGQRPYERQAQQRLAA